MKTSRDKLLKISCFLSLFLVLLLLQSFTITNTADFYISTDGNDQWSGTLASPNNSQTDGPFATLERARDAVRELKSNNKASDITVLIRGGQYYLNKMFCLV